MEYAVGTHFYLGDFCSDLSEAITAEYHPVQNIDLVNSFLSLAAATELKSQNHQDSDLVHYSVVFVIYAAWCDNIGQDILHLARPSDDEDADWWLTNDKPRTAQLLGSLMEWVVKQLSAASGAHRRENGYSFAEVFVQSITTEESLEQTKIRMHRERNPLKPIT